MNMMEWVICPICQNKTRLKISLDYSRRSRESG